MIEPNMKSSSLNEEDPITHQLYDDSIDIDTENDFDEAERKLRQISNSFPEQPFANFPLDDAEIDLILNSEESGIDEDLNSWLKDEDLSVLGGESFLPTDNVHNETITTTVVKSDDYEVDRTRVLRIAMAGFFTLFVMSVLGALLLFFDMQSQVDETRGSLHSLRAQLFGEPHATTANQGGSPLLESLLDADLKKKQQQPADPQEMKALQQSLNVVTSKVSSLEKLLEQLQTIKPVSVQAEAFGQSQTSEKQAKWVKQVKSQVVAGKRGKGWTVYLASFTNSRKLEKMYKRFRRQGVATEREQLTLKGKQWHRLYVPGFKSKQAARTFADKASEVLGLKGVWVARLS